MKVRWVCLGLAVCLVGCGGQSASDSSSGGKGGNATGGGGGGSGGAVGGAGGAVIGGAGGAVIGGGGGSGGTGATATTCSEAQKSIATLTPQPIGLTAWPVSASLSGVISEVTPWKLVVDAGASSKFDFLWIGPDLTQKFKPGESVSIGVQDGWEYVAGSTFTAAAFRQNAFVAPDKIPAIPYYGPALSYGVECQFDEPGQCGEPGNAVKLLSVSATTGAGPVVIASGHTGSLVGWDITNVVNVQYPGYGSQNCDVEAAFNGNITAIGPALDKGGG